MNKVNLKDNITDENFMIQVLNNLPKEYDINPDGLENRLDDVLTTEIICKKLNHWCKKYNKNEEKREKEEALGAYKKQYKQSAISVVSTITSLVMVNVQRINMSMKKMKKQKRMTLNLMVVS